MSRRHGTTFPWFRRRRGGPAPGPGSRPCRASAEESDSPSSTRSIAPSKARRCTRFLIWRSVMRSASAAVIPFCRRTPSVWLKSRMVWEMMKGPMTGILRSQASLFSRPASDAPPPGRDEADHGRDGDEEPVVEREVGARDQDPGRERHLAPQRMQQRLKAREQEEEEEHDDAEGRDDDHEREAIAVRSAVRSSFSRS